MPAGEEPRRPRLAPHVRLGRFRFDVPAIVSALENTGEPPRPDPRPTSVVFRAKPHSVLPELLRVGEWLAGLLADCTGELTVAELTERRARSDAMRPAMAKLMAMHLVECG